MQVYVDATHDAWNGSQIHSPSVRGSVTMYNRPNGSNLPLPLTLTLNLNCYDLINLSFLISETAEMLKHYSCALMLFQALMGKSKGYSSIGGSRIKHTGAAPTTWLHLLLLLPNVMEHRSLLVVYVFNFYQTL